MADSQIHFYYKNVMADIVGSEHGITESDFEQLAKQTVPVIKDVNNQREKGQTPYRDLPYDENYPERIKHIHLHDNLGGDSEKDDLHLPVGQGNINFREIFQGLNDVFNS